VLCRFALDGNVSETEELDDAKIEALSVEMRLVDKVAWVDSVVLKLEFIIDETVADDESFIVGNVEFHDAVNDEMVIPEDWRRLTKKKIRSEEFNLHFSNSTIIRISMEK
jgi:hypothetical protein